jgi:hypothetical protein
VISKLLNAAREVHSFMRRKRWKFCIIGGVAVEQWGEPRATRAVDITLLTGYAHEERFLDEILGKFKGRVPNPREFALMNRVVLCRASNGVEIDTALAGFAYEERVIARATPFPYAPKASLLTCSAEDLIILKAFAGRERDWLDVRGVIQRQTPRLDWDYIERELPTLADLKDDPSILTRLADMRQEVERKVEQLGKRPRK